MSGSAKAKGGMGAEVAVRKIDGDGNVVQEEGAADDSISRLTWFIILVWTGFGVVGVWRSVEILLAML